MFVRQVCIWLLVDDVASRCQEQKDIMNTTPEVNSGTDLSKSILDLKKLDPFIMQKDMCFHKGGLLGHETGGSTSVRRDSIICLVLQIYWGLGDQFTSILNKLECHL